MRHSKSFHMAITSFLQLWHPPHLCHTLFQQSAAERKTELLRQMLHFSVQPRKGLSQNYVLSKQFLVGDTSGVGPFFSGLHHLLQESEWAPCQSAQSFKLSPKDITKDGWIQVFSYKPQGGEQLNTKLGSLRVNSN